MDDKTIMDNILTATKGACDLMMHGAIESATPDVHGCFTRAFNDTLAMQNEIYAKMSEKGWYPSTQADRSEVGAVKQRFAANG